MKKLIFPITIQFVAVVITSCGDFREIGHVTYRTNGAHYATLGAVGYVSKHGKNTFEPFSRPNYKDVKVMLVNSSTIVKEAELNSKITVAENLVASGGIDTESKKTKRGTYKIFTILDRDKLIKKLNSPQYSSLRSRIKSEKEWRVVTSIVVVYNGKETDFKKLTVKAKSSNGITINGDGTAIDFDLRGKKSLDLTIGDGTIVGYSYAWCNFHEESDQIKNIFVDRVGYGWLTL